MTIQKPDFNQIFASQAPDIDKPPVFNNYNGGWGDESRPNNGKPTIKGFNYLQQLNDNKFLWMAQNGAFPYDPNIEYNVGIVTLKDGRFKQWNGTNWINFGQDDSALKSANNLSDLSNKETARNNLDVMSATEVNTAISSAIPSDVPNATETTAGKAKIATTAIAQAGVNDTDFITALKLANTRQSVWVNKTGMLFGTTYVNTALYEKEISFLSEMVSGLVLTAKVTFKKPTTNIGTIVYFGSVSNWTGGIASSANFTVPPNTSFKIEIVRTDSLSTVVTIAVNQWSERYYV